MSSLYILEIRPLSEVSLANIFSHTLGSLLILMLFSLAMKKLFISMRFHLFILSFMSLAHFLVGLFVFLQWSHVSSLYILEIKPLSKVSLANIFSHTFDSLFILLMFSLAVWKLFNLMKFHLFILFLMPLALGNISVKILLCRISDFPAFLLLGLYPKNP